MIPAGNVYLRVQGALSEVLSRQEWMNWESLIARHLNRQIQITEDRMGLEFPVIVGETLEDFLRIDQPPEAKRYGIFLVAEALRKLHRIEVSQPEIADWWLSHGDATSRNVIVNLETNTADWIDFDMRHRKNLSSVIRRADDLRTLLWSSACCLDPVHYPDCARTVFEGYADREIIEAVQQMTRDRMSRSVFQLSQAPLSAMNHAYLCQVILKPYYTALTLSLPVDSRH